MLQKIKEVRLLAVQFTRANPCCIRVIPYENNNTQTLTVCLYVDTDGNGVPRHVESNAKEIFPMCEIKCIDLQRRPLSKIVTRLPLCKRKKGKQIFDLSRKIEDNLYVFENRLNVTAVCASYKVAEAVEKEIPCVTVFVLGKGKIPVNETSIQSIKRENSHLFDNAEFDVVEGYYRPAYGPSPEKEYAFPLRGGIGIGVQGILRAGTLGGFLEDENGECYILSCDHVLNPPKSKNNTLSSNDGSNGVVDVTGTSAVLMKDVNGISDGGPTGVVHGARIFAGLKEGINNPNDDCSNGVVCSAAMCAGLREDEGRPVGQIVEQPARKDYDKMLQNANLEYKEVKTKFSDIANLTQAERDDLKLDTYGARRLKQFEKENLHAKQKLQEIEEGKPRRIGEYVGGLKRNVKMKCGNKTYSFFVDVAIAKLDKEELEFITKDKADNKNRCEVYGFHRIGNVVPTGEIVDLDTFVKEIREDSDKLTFSKIGRTTGLTDYGQIVSSFQELFIKRDSLPGMADTPFTYCINCKPSDVGEAELVANDCSTKECPTCGNKAFEVLSSWQHNCFAIRKERKIFSEKGDSGSLIFDNDGRAWGLLQSGFIYGNYDITLASPLTVALKALEMKCGKKLKFW